MTRRIKTRIQRIIQSIQSEIESKKLVHSILNHTTKTRENKTRFLTIKTGVSPKNQESFSL